jgi:hypothetical protein
MTTRSGTLRSIGVLLIAASWAALCEAAPTALKAFYREGQTFLTFQEDASVEGERYRIYRSERPITADTLGDAKLCAVLLEGSCRFRQPIHKLNPKKPTKKHPDLITFKNFVLHDVDKGGKPLPDGTGLLVWTVKKPGERYYAIVQEKDGRAVSKPAAGVSSLENPIDEKVEVPGAVKVVEIPPAGWYYCHWMDYELWNPRKIDDTFVGYGFLFHVAVPDDKAQWAQPLPVTVRGHGRGAVRGGAASNRTRSGIMVRPKDFMSTWFYGHSNALTWFGPNQYRWNKSIDEGTVVNYFWRRVHHMLKWLGKRPKNFVPVAMDPHRVYWIGFSMGATGGNTVAIRHGDIFAGVVADKGLVNWMKASSPGTNDWHRSVWRFWGTPKNSLKTLEGESIWDRMNIPKWLAEHPEAEIPYMGIVYGRVDGSISFEAAPDYVAALQKGRHPFVMAWNMSGHIPTWGTGARNDPMKQRRDESLPAFANATCNTPLADVPFYGGRFRLYQGTFEELTERTMKSATTGNFKGFTQDLAGKYLAINPYPYAPGGPTFRIESNTKDTITIADGNLKTAHWTDKRKGVRRFVVCHDRPDGTINVRLEWSSSTHDFDPKSRADDIVDEPARYELSVRLARLRRKGMEYEPDDPDATCTADITPRRLQKFKVEAGETVRWENWDCADPKAPRKIASGEMVVDKHGLVTVETFTIGKKGLGNRLKLKRD